MKTLMYLLFVAILVTTGCAKDDMPLEEPTSFKAELKAVADLNSELVLINCPDPAELCKDSERNSDFVLVNDLDPADPTSYYYTRMLISGEATHLGKIDPNKSYYTFENCVLFMKNGQPFTLNTGTGILVGTNGESVEFTFEIKQSAIDFSFTGRNKIIPGTGTGKFECCTGTINSVGGLLKDGTLWSKNEGFLVYE